MEPVKRKTAVRPPDTSFADCLGHVYASTEEPHDIGDVALLAGIEDITVEEVQYALQKLSKRERRRQTLRCDGDVLLWGLVIALVVDGHLQQDHAHRRATN